MVLIFVMWSSKLSFNFVFFNFFLYDFFISKAGKLEVAVSNPIMEDIGMSPSSSFGWGSFPSLSRSSLSLSLSFSLFVDSALQLLLCDVLSPSVILIINEV